MTVVVDASVVVAALVDGGPTGSWAEGVLAAGGLAAPHLMPVESANILRRMRLAGDLTADVAALAHADLQALPCDLLPYSPLAARAWDLGATVTSYDGWYVALAEVLDAPLATLDLRLTRAPGLRCRFVVPP